MDHSEPQFEALLELAYPGYQAQIEGCSAAELEALEALSPAPLPPFYRWFMARFGRKLGPLEYPYTDLRAQAILDFYEEEYEGEKPPLAHGFVIGTSKDGMWPELRYKLQHGARDDARAVVFTLGKDTFREWLAWGIYLAHVIPRYPQVCEGTLFSGSFSIIEELGEILTHEGFSQPIAGGTRTLFCSDAETMIMFDGDFNSNGVMSFYCGAASSARARELLGLLTTELNLEVAGIEWEPPLDA